MGFIWFFIFLTSFSVLAYHRSALSVWAMSFALLVVFFTVFSHLSLFSIILTWTLFLVIFMPLLVTPWRRRLISWPILKFYLQAMPTMSRTEKEALAAGSVTWEGDLFRGNPRWEKLLAMPKPTLSAEEEAFLAGPVEELCGLIHDWDITHNLTDLPVALWKFIKTKGFFGLIIPKEYGGKGFSAYAHSQILVKVYSRSATVATTISVPNSLGPAELLLHYGTQEQKQYYLPRLARGEEVPCFALTGPEAGSDAGAMTDTGIVCWGEQDGQRVLGIRLHFDKRYITLAPVATVIGLAFKLYDPDHLLGNKKELGITCALIPRNTPGMHIGRRHFPINIPFQNGPLWGKDVFIPIDWIIGGPQMVGQGWRMLMECLATGRAISLPASSLGGAKLLSFATGAYAKVRRQFNTPIGEFEGVAEVLARMAGYTYMMDATRTLTAVSIDLGEKPAVASAITKYHVTELGRLVVNDAMDIHGGKGICLGPLNYVGRFYESLPIAITVEGANILTRCMIIFGQGAMRCHPYILTEFEAAQLADKKQRLAAFDKAVIGHIGYTGSNMVRSFILGLTAIYRRKSSRNFYFQAGTRFSAAFALIADISLLVLGGALKRKESISARLGDILSYLYILSAVLKHDQDQGSPAEDIPLVQWACETCLYQIQQRFTDILQNFPNRWVSAILKLLIFPLGISFAKPTDQLNFKLAKLILEPSATLQRLVAGAYLSPDSDDVMGELNEAFHLAIQIEPIERILKKAVKDKKIRGKTLLERAKTALHHQIISEAQYALVKKAETLRKKVIAVDDFDPADLPRVTTEVTDTIVLSPQQAEEGHTRQPNIPLPVQKE